ncbi:hypothetical protein PC9H_004713 [Pleurotus ostreatus]|uniref:Atg29 N-terminal domain-containing protein n=1 Tax=Pleurotus ostreatus TaxID=5322 RepID=A0A8H6ZVP6_PLEOS|nr:uncharacterized protein PC9H_004713 [Pleurotus ostreatus]KAF7432770.1 hypothetical protein PC9H_004713 [Pleurotus ostreatus]
MPAPSVRVVVRIPTPRPDQPIPDPPRIEWTPEKADILWKVIELSRSSDNGGTDWKGLAAHLEVPLPYLLYRVHTRFEEDLRGLKDIGEVLSPSSTQPPGHEEMFPSTERPSIATRMTSRMSGSGRRTSTRLTTPLAVRARLHSLGHASQPKKATSSSTLTLQAPRKGQRPSSTSDSSEETDSDEEAAQKEDETLRGIEEEEALARKLQDLQTMINNDALGLVSSPRPKQNKGKETGRGRLGLTPSSSVNSSLRGDTLSSRSTSQSLSSTNSPQGSIPDIPSPPPDSQLNSPLSRHMSAPKSSSPPAVSPRSAIGQSHRHYGLIDRAVSEQGSSVGSEASSFSDISGEPTDPSLRIILCSIQTQASPPQR